MKIELNTIIAAAGARADARFTAFKRAQADVDAKRGEIRRVERRVRDQQDTLKEARKTYSERVARHGAGHRLTRLASNDVTVIQHRLKELEQELHVARTALDRLDKIEQRAIARLQKARAALARYRSPEFARRLKKRAQHLKSRAAHQADKAQRVAEREQAAITASAPEPEPSPAPVDPLADLAKEVGLDPANLTPEDRKVLEDLARITH